SNCIFSLSIHPLHSYIFPLSLHDALPILLALSDRVEAAFRGAALTAGVEVDVVWDAEPIYLPHRVNEPLAQRYAATLADRREVLPVSEEAAGGSSDIGNVSHLFPTIQPTVAIGDPDIPGHSRERADTTLTPDGRRAIVDSAIGLAQTAADVLTDDDLRRAACAAFAEAGEPVRLGDRVPLAPWPQFPAPPARCTTAHRTGRTCHIGGCRSHLRSLRSASIPFPYLR